MEKRDLRELPRLDGWLTFPDAAAELGISRQRFHQLAEKDNPAVITTAVRIGNKAVYYLVRTAEVERLKLLRGKEGGQHIWTD